MTASAPLTLGTAGHIDHGKTALIAALTGVDTDRLPEERARGISIELGYARLDLPSGRHLSVIDVPGHERFVRTMVAGASGIDLYLMAVAADDGVMPQTREHAAVLSALAVDAGVVAVTKSDVADPELAMVEASELLPGAQIVATSTRGGAGLDELRAALDRVAQTLRSRAAEPGAACLHIDRVFTIHGAGTVITGTLWSGTIRRGAELQLLPGARRARVRGVQVHDEPVEEAGAGQRVAVNLTGSAVADIARGDVLSDPDAELRPTFLIDAQLEFAGGARQPEHGDRVQVHHGTRESPARLAWLGCPFWQIRLEQPLIPAREDRLVIRQIAPPDTIGGGSVLDPHPRKHGPSRDNTARLERLVRGEEDAAAVTPQRAATPERAATPGRAATPQRATPVRPCPAEPVPKLSRSALELEIRLRTAGLEPPLDAELDPDDLAALRAAGRVIRVSKTLHFHADTLGAARTRVIELAERHGGSVTLAQLRDALGTSRKFAQALIEHFDAEKLTIRRGDTHYLRRAARSSHLQLG